ncbi:twitching motility protein PilT [Rhizobium leguminosarum bv. trifolii WSM1689]|uniref:type II toxin-antitoxin system VapC family toxin n=1 Tax=Rhizobium TaxID=379 RepID=UPI0003E09D4A|nr:MULTISPECIES: type II toxin-antitoxin system VapC family toxin [Rhizobium]AHF84726.1 twitching motility protein PilT [Rhizobium leguminosarum bv. trifolii WSM1689]MBY3157065.1 type II toxin-antitoxin system VapC family toxin [Rhizobium laguerreae]MBY3171462.1 type II toxin-antitoxin system VapC family toxin [Rhizobium laguerreae]MBY3193508.1 type II toxin-antitoxin system VapC family toxin [Rhizobium laguerreae]MBY3226644.1 type II toxin-antitoxin system VapC family toxin [Rhizobium laguerr
MRVIDSSAWIEWLTKSAAGTRLQAEIPERDQCIVPTIVQLELSKWLAREKDEEAVDSFIAYTATCMVVSLDTTLARRAAEISAAHKLATADAIIYATAECHNADILTCEAHFKDLERVIYIDKKD